MLWARAAGRCEVCGRSLLEGEITHQEMTLGEAAHIVGATDSGRSPRGKSPMSLGDRAKADNLILMCASHHDEIDRPEAVELLTEERLQAMKAAHEDFVRRAMRLRGSRTSVIVRLIGDLRGDAVQLDVGSAVEAVLDDGRFPEFAPGFDGVGVSIELDQLPDEEEPTAEYWKVATRKIDQVIGQKLKEGIRQGAIERISVFGFARLPLLTYLGAALDDTCPVEIYQRHRTGDTWVWPKEEGEASFAINSAGTAAEDAVLILNLSGTVEATAIPAVLAALPVFTIGVEGRAPGPESIRTKGDLARFAEAVRQFFADREQDGKLIKRLHVLAAAPISAAIQLGRAHDAHVHPVLVLYDRTSAGTYKQALSIP